MDTNIWDAIERLNNDVESAESHCRYVSNTVDATNKSRKTALENQNREVYQAVVRFLEDAELREPIKV